MKRNKLFEFFFDFKVASQARRLVDMQNENKVLEEKHTENPSLKLR